MTYGRRVGLGKWDPGSGSCLQLEPRRCSLLARGTDAHRDSWPLLAKTKALPGSPKACLSGPGVGQRTGMPSLSKSGCVPEVSGGGHTPTRVPLVLERSSLGATPSLWESWRSIAFKGGCWGIEKPGFISLDPCAIQKHPLIMPQIFTEPSVRRAPWKFLEIC